MALLAVEGRVVVVEEERRVVCDEISDEDVEG